MMKFFAIWTSMFILDFILWMPKLCEYNQNERVGLISKTYKNEDNTIIWNWPNDFIFGAMMTFPPKILQ